MTVRVRIAPAPSGSLHVGNVRTALYNWLFARHNGGVFMLRVEDTDPSRVVEEHYKTIQDDLSWLGLEWDEGPGVGGPYEPYLQSERLDVYKDATEKLQELGVLYRCYCTPEELAAKRQAAMEAKRPPRYDRRCLQLSDKERSQFEGEGRPFVMRIRTPDDGTTSFTDMVTGEVSFDNAELDDVVVVRSDGRPLYRLAVSVDDGIMKITHVIRGLDLQSSTPHQIIMLEALGYDVPLYAHLPMVKGPGGRPLGKRFGGESLQTFRELGYLPETMMNYLALLGWGLADQTIIPRDELIEKFEISNVHASPANIDPDRLDWMNGEYIRGLDESDLAERLMPWLAKAGLVTNTESDEQKELVKVITPLVQTRIGRLSEAPDLVKGIFSDPEIDPASAERGLKEDYVGELLDKGAEKVGGLQEWSRDAIEEALRGIQTEMGLKPKRAFIPFYVAVHGSPVGAPIFDSIHLIGKEKFLQRVAKARALIS